VTNSIILCSLIGLGMQGLGFQEIAPTLGRTKTNTLKYLGL